MNRILLSLMLVCCVWARPAFSEEPAPASSEPPAACSGGGNASTSTKSKVGFRVLYGDLAPLVLGASETAPVKWRRPEWTAPVFAEFSTQPDGSLRIAVSIEAAGAKKKVKEATLKVGEAIVLDPTKDVTAGYFGANPSSLKIEFTGPHKPKS
ncbi:hypothetical protein LZ198_15020 [Myxococcus sp. K15C18031901]|uniref:hypothetical protein n=1 Tax=Myxococcus dinghuensis TaxID=2906761 RepID=UPI0020A7193C|nr:hypothetical protein [Myxococcus dinghuensis]MCP3100184.1 hypothetical protein [Myxococcus dinghuensis]